MTVLDSVTRLVSTGLMKTGIASVMRETFVKL